jgi:hypothetical protein
MNEESTEWALLRALDDPKHVDNKLNATPK